MSHPRVSTAEAFELMQKDGYAYLDVRTVAEFDLGHVSGAFNVPVRIASDTGLQPNPDFLAVMTKNFAPNSKLVVGCQSGNRSQKAAQILVEAGYEHIVEHRSGWKGASDPFGRVTEMGWQASSLPTSTQADAAHDYESLSTK